MKNYKVSLTIRIAAGLYLLYSAFSLGKALLNKETDGIFIIIAAIAFTGFGIYFMISGFTGMRRMEQKAAEESQETEMMDSMEKVAETEPTKLPKEEKSMSIGERARMQANLSEEGEE